MDTLSLTKEAKIYNGLKITHIDEEIDHVHISEEESI